jgi:hypothetical protein
MFEHSFRTFCKRAVYSNIIGLTVVSIAIMREGVGLS